MAGLERASRCHRSTLKVEQHKLPHSFLLTGLPKSQKGETSVAKKRGNNEGSVFKRKDGRWCAQVSLSGRRIT
jgi:hypothetical protein